LDIENDVCYERLGAAKQTVRSRKHCDALLSKIPLSDYDATRNFPADTSGTSMLSPYTRFGLVSPRQIMARVIDGATPGTQWNAEGVTMDKKVFKNSFVSELAWREFRRHIDRYFPEVRTVAFQEKRRNIRWENREDRFGAWKECRTGYPIVDA
jgi:deoxyribodipyrimidine photo-lyase